MIYISPLRLDYLSDCIDSIFHFFIDVTDLSSSVIPGEISSLSLRWPLLGDDDVISLPHIRILRHIFHYEVSLSYKSMNNEELLSHSVYCSIACKDTKKGAFLPVNTES